MWPTCGCDQRNRFYYVTTMAINKYYWLHVAVWQTFTVRLFCLVYKTEYTSIKYIKGLQLLHQCLAFDLIIVHSSFHGIGYQACLDFTYSCHIFRRKSLLYHFKMTYIEIRNIWSWAPDGARHQDWLTGWPSVVMGLWLWEYCDVHAVGQQSTVETLVYNRC
jgi:hypothetical protein